MTSSPAPWWSAPDMTPFRIPMAGSAILTLGSALLLAMAIGLAPPATAQPADASSPKATLILHFVEIKPDRGGDLVASLFSGEDTWLKPEGVVQKTAGEVDGDSMTLRLEGVPFGDSYAVQAFHDANRNGELDFRRVIPIPAEGIGVSNNHERMGPPKYKDAEFKVDRPEIELTIVVRYY